MVDDLSKAYGANNVVAVDTMGKKEGQFECAYAQMDAINRSQLEATVMETNTKVLLHNGVRCTMARPSDADLKQLLKQNIETTQNVLEVAREHNLKVILLHRFSHSKVP